MTIVQAAHFAFQASFAIGDDFGSRLGEAIFCLLSFGCWIPPFPGGPL